jgi:nucleotide-binding universal stress UspA family protein
MRNLRRAGLPDDVDALVVSVEEAPVVPSLGEAAESAGERAVSIVEHVDRHVNESLTTARFNAEEARGLLSVYFPKWRASAAPINGRPATELIDKAREWSADLIVVGSQGRSGVGRFILGSVSLEVALESPVSVRIGRQGIDQYSQRPLRIIVGVDGLPGSEETIAQVLKREWPEGSELRVIAVDDGTSPIKMSGDETDSSKTDEMNTVAGTRGLKVTAEIRKGDPAEVLLDVADEWEADGIFVAGSFGNASEDLRSSVATRLAIKAKCSIEIVR